MDSEECALCMGAFADPRALSCLHTFCLECLRGVLPLKQCPNCRHACIVTADTVDELPRNFWLNRNNQKREQELEKELEERTAMMEVEKEALVAICQSYHGSLADIARHLGLPQCCDQSQAFCHAINCNAIVKECKELRSAQRSAASAPPSASRALSGAERARAEFHAVDIAKTGYINAVQFQMILTRLGKDMSQDDAAAIFAVYDTDANGQLDVREFCTCFCENF